MKKRINFYCVNIYVYVVYAALCYLCEILLKFYYEFDNEGSYKVQTLVLCSRSVREIWNYYFYAYLLLNFLIINTKTNRLQSFIFSHRFIKVLKGMLKTHAYISNCTFSDVDFKICLTRQHKTSAMFFQAAFFRDCDSVYLWRSWSK